MTPLPKNKITVVVATYNGESTIKKTLDSLVNQTFKEFNVIISDDASKDNTAKISQEYCEKYKNFFFIKNKINKGMFKNYNNILQRITSDYVTLLDQDDYREPLFLEECYKLFNEDENISMVHCHTGVISKIDNVLTHVNTLSSLNNISCVKKRYIALLNNYLDTLMYGLINTKILQKTNLFQPINGSQVCLVYELCLLGKFLEVNKVLSYYHGMGLIYRPSPEKELLRSAKKKSNFPPGFLLALYQIKSIKILKSNLLIKFQIFFYILIDFIKTNLLKFTYRFFSFFLNKKIDNFLFKICLFLNKETSDKKILVDKEKYSYMFPKHYPYRKIVNNDK